MMEVNTAQASDLHSGREHVRVPRDAVGWPEELVYEDGVPLDSPLHRHQMNLLTDLIDVAMAAQGHDAYYVGGDMFIYYDREQAGFVARTPPPAYRHVVGPDVFFVGRVDPKQRPAWIVWLEDQRYPDLIVELLSPSTKHIDRGVKRHRYATQFHTSEYYLYEPAGDAFEALRLGPGGIYQPAPRNEQGWVWSEALGVWLGLWQGRHQRTDATWLRLYDAGGRLLPTGTERAEQEQKRAEAAEAEVVRLRALLAGSQRTPGGE